MNTKKIIINKKNYTVNNDEFEKVIDEEFCNLHILKDVGSFERISGLLNELMDCLKINKNDNTTQKEKTNNLFLYSQTHGGFIALNTCLHIEQNYMSYFVKTNEEHIENVKTNISNNFNSHSNFSFLNDVNVKNVGDKTISNEYLNIIYSEKSKNINPFFLNTEYNKLIAPIVLTSYDWQSNFLEENPHLKHLYTYYFLSPIANDNTYSSKNVQYALYIPNIYLDSFLERFKYYIIEGTNNLNYNNLIHLCVMVKNGGDLFREMLSENINIVDKWTILDTGSTDDTIKNIKEICVGKKPGNLYEEPFINFRDSRNRCLELAGNSCKFKIMLDDTYIIKGDLRNFLERVRGDQNADSYSINILSRELRYLSNRITKSELNLRYMYTMHEIIQDYNNMNVGLPFYCSWIDDKVDDFMNNRSNTRLEYDLKCLQDMVEETPDEPRHIYYIAQTYKNMKRYEEAAEYYFKRAFHKNKGFDQEQFDALFEHTRIKQLNLNASWDQLESLYELCIEWQPTRPEGDYMIGIYYYNNGNKKKAYDRFKRAFEIGFPHHQQYSTKPILSYHYVPYYLCDLCYDFKNYDLGLAATTLYLQNNKPTDNFYDYIVDWYKIFEKLVAFKNIKSSIINESINDSSKIFCIVADGGFTKWSGKNLITTGVGGSETWVIETARYIKKLTNYRVVVFCNCEAPELFEDVEYMHLEKFIHFISSNQVEDCIISRFSEYVPVSIEGYIKNIHIILHDIKLSGNVIPVNPKIKNIFCLTEWHKKLFLESFEVFRDRTHVLHYGIDMKNYNFEMSPSSSSKIKNSFIYSSFPNRGLLVLLKMWTKIQKMFPDASLNIFVDLENDWVNKNYPEEIIEIKKILDEYKQLYPNVINHGWVSKKKLSEFWKNSHIWLYPCKFAETFCLTALEAAISKTLVFTNDLAALQDTVGDRGVVVKGDTTTPEWQESMLNKIHFFLHNEKYTTALIEKNYEWALKHSWEDRVKDLLKTYISPNSSFTYTQTLPSLQPQIDPKPQPHPSIVLPEIPPPPLPPFSQTQEIKQQDELPALFYINLNSRTDRYKHVLDEIEKINYPKNKVYRFEAIDGSLENNYDESVKKVFKNVNYLYYPSYNKVMANQLSHIKILELMISKNIEKAIICQDDVVFIPEFSTYLKKVLSNLPEDAEFVQLGMNKYSVRDVVVSWDFEKDSLFLKFFSQMFTEKWFYINENKKKVLITANDHKNKCEELHNNGGIITLTNTFDSFYNCPNTTCYLVTLNGAKNYLNNILKNGVSYAADFDMNAYLIDKNIYYCSSKIIATTLPTLGSDIFPNIYNSIESGTPYINDNNRNLDYNKEYNWSADFPKHSKLEFVKLLSRFCYLSKCNILELGSFVGTSAISILQYLPNASIKCLDFLDEKQEEIFKNNMKHCNNNKKLNFINSDISKTLIKESCYNNYDIIRIEGERPTINIILDCFLAWRLLKVEGIMVITTTNFSKKNIDDLDFFINKKLDKNSYEVTTESFHVFIKKLN